MRQRCDLNSHIPCYDLIRTPVTDWVYSFHCRTVGFGYDQLSFQERFLSDLDHAKQSAVIVSPYVTLRRTRWLEPIFSTLTSRRIPITVITRPSSSFQGQTAVAAETAINSLRTANITVTLREGIHQKHAVIDGSIVWYGSINLLSFGASQESIMRLVSGSVARALNKY